MPPGAEKKATGCKPVLQKSAKYAINHSKLHFAVPKPANAAKEKPKKVQREKQKNDPKLIAAARELRDRWVERMNEDPAMLESQGKYKVARALPETRPATALLAA